MKKVFLSFALIVISLITSAQIDREVFNRPKRIIAEKDIQKSTEYFQKASTNLTVGAVCTFVAGPLLMYASTTIPIDMEDGRNINEMPSKIILGLGGVTSLCGVISIIVGSVQIGKAGAELEKERKKYLSLSDNGIGVKFTF